MRRTILVAAAVAVLIGLIASYLSFVQRPHYEAAAIAEAETEMWKAYYGQNPRRLARELFAVQRRQFGLSTWQAAFITRDLATAAIVFIDRNAPANEAVLPHLVSAYRRIKKASGLNFDPEEAARAELAWWVARRDPKTRSPEQVGEEITRLYAILYGKRTPGMERAGLLRAQAAHLRDTGAPNPDWPQVQALLVASYTELAADVS